MTYLQELEAHTRATKEFWASVEIRDGWIPVAKELPEKHVVVETKIDDAKGLRNQTKLMRGGNSGRLWIVPDGSMYVYYEPTHWRPIDRLHAEQPESDE